ncbi:MAG: hypothetical protein ABI281_09180, partial [Caldimonas sp.]
SDIALPMEIVRGLPADLPTRADLEFGQAPLSIDFGETEAVAEPAPEFAAESHQASAEAVSEDVSFEFDLSGLDAPLDIGTLNPEVTGAGPAAGVDASAMFDPFVDSRLPGHDEAMQTTLTNEQFQPEPSDGTLDLDLDLEPASVGEPPSTIESMTPSASPVLEDHSGLSIDLSTGEALPFAGDAAAADIDSASGVDFEIGADAQHGDGGVDEHVKVVGSLRIGIPLFNIYLNEADELSRRLMTEIAEWTMELHRPIGEVPVALAHSLAGSSATVGFADLSHLARGLEHALARSQVIGHGTADEARLFVDAAEEIRRLLHQFAAGFLKEPVPELLTRLAEHEISSSQRLEAVTAASELAEGQETVSPPEPEAIDSLLSLEGLDSAEVAAAVEEPVAIESEPTQEAPANREAEAHDGEPEAEAAPEPEPEPELVSGSGSVSEPGPETETAADAETGKEPALEPGLELEPGEQAGAEPHPEPAAEPEPAESVLGGLGPFNTLGVSPLKPLSAAPTETARPLGSRGAALSDADDDIDAVDAVDLELFPIFEEEALELLPKLDGQLRDWARHPAAPTHPAACMRTLHTL